MKLKTFIGIVELPTKAVSISSYLVGTLLALRSGAPFRPLRALLMLAATLAVDMGTTAWNSYYDYLRGVDRPTTNRESNKVLVHDAVPPGTALGLSAGLFGAAMVLGLALGFIVGFGVVAVGALCMLVGFLYNGGPLPISRTPFGEVAAGGFLGSVLVLITYYVQTEGLSAAALLGSLPSTCLIASILTVNNTCDIEGDREAERRTLSIVLGRRAGEMVVYGLGFGAFAGTAVLALYGVFPRTALAAALVAGAGSALIYRRMGVRGYGHETKTHQMKDILLILILYTLALTLAYLVDAVFLAREPGAG